MIWSVAALYIVKSYNHNFVTHFVPAHLRLQKQETCWRRTWCESWRASCSAASVTWRPSAWRSLSCRRSCDAPRAKPSRCRRRSSRPRGSHETLRSDLQQINLCAQPAVVDARLTRCAFHTGEGEQLGETPGNPSWRPHQTAGGADGPAGESGGQNSFGSRCVFTKLEDFSVFDQCYC